MVLIQNLISRREDFKTLYIRGTIHKILRICTIQKKIKHHCSSTLPNQKFQEPFIIIQISLFFNRNFSNPKFNIFQSQYQKNSKYILCIVARSTMDKSKDTPISCNPKANQPSFPRTSSNQEILKNHKNHVPPSAIANDTPILAAWNLAKKHFPRCVRTIRIPGIP